MNKTEVSHSSDKVGIEVFAEPDSIICLRGYAKPAASSRSSDNENDAVSLYYTSNMAGRRKIRVFGPAKKTWFFQCGNAR